MAVVSVASEVSQKVTVPLRLEGSADAEVAPAPPELLPAEQAVSTSAAAASVAADARPEVRQAHVARHRLTCIGTPIDASGTGAERSSRGYQPGIGGASRE